MKDYNTDNEKIYQTILVGIKKLRELHHPNSKHSEIVIMTGNKDAVNSALKSHGQYLSSRGIIKTRLIEKICRVFAKKNEATK